MPDERDDFISSLLNEDAIASLDHLPIAPALPPSNEGLEASFFAAVHQFFRCWLEDKGGGRNGAAPCAIILSRAVDQDIKRLCADTIWYFASSADASIEGKIFIASYDLSVVAQVPCSICPDPKAIGDTLVNLGLADSVHCMLRGDRSTMHLCRSGLNGGSTKLDVGITSTVRLDSSTIDIQLWEFHRKFTQTPSGVLLPWKGKTEDRITIENAELRISMMLGFFLQITVGQDNVTVEDQTSHGRIDLKISRHAMKDELGPCALECKVLRSHEAAGTSPRNVPASKMIKHASDGVQQAVQYRADIKGKLAYLCCFDARDLDEDQPEIQVLAAANDVTLRRYYMYSSAAAHRDAEAAAVAEGKILSGAVA